MTTPLPQNLAEAVRAARLDPTTPPPFLVSRLRQAITERGGEINLGQGANAGWLVRLRRAGAADFEGPNPVCALAACLRHVMESRGELNKSPD